MGETRRITKDPQSTTAENSAFRRFVDLLRDPTEKGEHVERRGLVRAAIEAIAFPKEGF